MIQKSMQNRDHIVLLTPKEVAHIMKINYRKVLDMIALGQLKAYRLGRVFRISQDDLNKFLESSRYNEPWSHHLLK